MKQHAVILASLFSACIVGADEPSISIASAHTAVSNFVVTMQSEIDFPRPVFSKAEISASTNSIIVTAPGFMISVGSASPSTNSLLHKTWHSTPSGFSLVVQHFAHEYVEPIHTPPVFSPKPRGIESTHIIKSPIIFKRPESKEIQVLLDALARQGINMKADNEEAPNKVLDTYFPKAANGLQKNGQH